MLFLRTHAPAIMAAALLSLAAKTPLTSPLAGQEIIQAAKAGRIDLVREMV